MSSHARNCARPAFFDKNAAPYTWRRLRAVVADDAPDMRDCISAIFEIEGGAEVVATASDGISAIRAAYALRPDLVVLDISMPLMNGFQAVPHIKRHLSDTKVLLVSADDDPELGLCALDCGADGFIWKGLIGRPVQKTDPVDVWQTCSRKPHLVGSDHTAKSRIRLVTK